MNTSRRFHSPDLRLAAMTGRNELEAVKISYISYPETCIGDHLLGLGLWWAEQGRQAAEGTLQQMRSNLTSDKRGLIWNTRRARAAGQVDQQREVFGLEHTQDPGAKQVDQRPEGFNLENVQGLSSGQRPEGFGSEGRRAQAAVLVLDAGIVSTRSFTAR